MFVKGFLVLFWPDGHAVGEQGLAMCPVLAADKEAARKAFLETSPQATIATVFSIEELGAHRRQILELAQQSGADLSIG